MSQWRVKETNSNWCVGGWKRFGRIHGVCGVMAGVFMEVEAWKVWEGWEGVSGGFL